MQMQTQRCPAKGMSMWSLFRSRHAPKSCNRPMKTRILHAQGVSFQNLNLADKCLLTFYILRNTLHLHEVLAGTVRVRGDRPINRLKHRPATITPEHGWRKILPTALVNLRIDVQEYSYDTHRYSQIQWWSSEKKCHCPRSASFQRR